MEKLKKAVSGNLNFKDAYISPSIQLKGGRERQMARGVPIPVESIDEAEEYQGMEEEDLEAER